ncbi:hypothetical protein [Arcanobacterium hippocoleae]|uniref:Phage P1-related protein n=1 Tax=Arcanobacterium hippocoleae TaxID=149017 RepID=A0ABU1T051_9ACTO|nr:hypothetical protein [Arcanobacterium hippocoleae]MDR6938681.1 hypothetical protein [Arcanobacterium hippocoleae]
MTSNRRFTPGQRYNPKDMTLDNYIEGLYQLFLSDLITRPLAWKNNGSTVSLRRHPEIEGRHAVFWHIISGGTGAEMTRQIEHQRCIRIHWIRLLVEIFNEEFPQETQIRWWIDEKRSSRHRYVITRPEFDYIVVIEQRDSYALLVTAYYAEQEHRRRKLKREHDDFWQKQEPPKE